MKKALLVIALALAGTISAAAFDVSALGPRVVAYIDDQRLAELAAGNRVVLNFAADWCPSCQATFRDIQKNFRQIPEGVVLVFVDYDQARALRTRYGVTTQHTFVSLDARANKKDIWVGSRTLAAILARLE